MNLARSLERHVDHFLERVGTLVAPGPLSAGELASRLIREIDLSIDEMPTGPRAPNLIQVSVAGLEVDAQGLDILEAELARMLTETGLDRGWRFEGPVKVEIESSSGRSAVTDIAMNVSQKQQLSWAFLRGPRSFGVGVNRAVLGRAVDADVVIPHPTISRYHALLWQEAGSSWLQDLDSTNGTMLDGTDVSEEAADIETGSVVTLGASRHVFELAR